jgi:hypothetical protein
MEFTTIYTGMRFGFRVLHVFVPRFGFRVLLSLPSERRSVEGRETEREREMERER